MDEIVKMFDARIDKRSEEHAEQARTFAEQVNITKDKASKEMHSFFWSSMKQIKESFDSMTVDISEKLIILEKWSNTRRG